MNKRFMVIDRARARETIVKIGIGLFICGKENNKPIHDTQ